MSKRDTKIQLITTIKKRGLKITPSRTRVLDVFLETVRPLSADDVYERVSDIMDRVTVYRTLSILRDVGCLSRFTFRNKHVYELATAHSHYVICRQCEKIERIQSCTLNNIEKISLASAKNFALVDQHTLQLSGTCKACASI